MMKLRTLPIVFGAALLSAACSGQSAETPPLSESPTGLSDLQIAVASADFETGAPRVPLILFNGTERVADVQSLQIATFDLAGGTPTATGWSGAAENFSDYEVPYWVVYPEIPAAGYWGLSANVALADGSHVQAQFVIETVAEAPGPQPGDPAPASYNRTLATERDIALLSSAFEPVPALYEQTVADALATGRPTVVAFSTPAFCQTQLCAPVLDSVESVYADFGDRANFIHIEVYKDFETFEFADEMTEWDLNSEPWVFLIDADGAVAARFGGPLSPRELTAALQPLLD
ncbi:MAG: thioredoxin family protein [Anaerolineales bacterium]